MPKGEVIKVNGVRYLAVENDPANDFDFNSLRAACSNCDYEKDFHPCKAFCCEMGLYMYHFKRLDNKENENRNLSDK